jgi:hypothetical protein
MKYTVKRIKLSNADLTPWKVIANGKIAASRERKHQAEYVASRWNAEAEEDRHPAYAMMQAQEDALEDSYLP